MAKSYGFRQTGLRYNRRRTTEARFGLKDQIRRAAVSIPTNIAEGFERSSRKEYLLFLNIAKGSAGEVRSLCQVAFDVGYVNQSTYDELREASIVISKSLFNQIQAIRNAPVKT